MIVRGLCFYSIVQSTSKVIQFKFIQPNNRANHEERWKYPRNMNKRHLIVQIFWRKHLYDISHKNLMWKLGDNIIHASWFGIEMVQICHYCLIGLKQSHLWIESSLTVSFLVLKTIWALTSFADLLWKWREGLRKLQTQHTESEYTALK